jgi:hypothetical protein
LSDLQEIARLERPEAVALMREALLCRGRRVVVRVSSDSMQPVLEPGDRIIIEKAEPRQLRWGDIVVYESPLAGLIVHRLVWMVPPLSGAAGARAVYTKGDALPYLDRPVPAEGILGRVVEVRRGSRRRRIRRATTFWSWAATAARWGLGRRGRETGRSVLTHGENR